ncbi:MAG: HAD family hydrolase [Chloroflexi bacterium HGW-Chloroflexi-2]|jgi:sugar-phosphatase|nr:MAG: HAD family hydrolase [Chloroflexi bacterium HGW-Chloroflexi-2]
MTDKKITLTCHAILFDLDGVLLDSTSCIERHWQEWADKHELDLKKVLQNAHGVRTIETIKIVAPHLDAKNEAAEFTANEILDTEGVVAIPGAKELMEHLPTGKWAIVTSGGFELVQARLKKADLPMPKYIISADDVTQGKPSPQPYLMGANKLEVPVDQCVVVEDAPIGVKAGKAAGMRVIGIASTHPHKELLDVGVDFLVENLLKIQISENAQSQSIIIKLKTR